MRSFTTIIVSLLALAPATAWTQETSVTRQADDDLIWNLQVRLDVPLVSSELINTNHGTSVLIGGSIGLDIYEFVVFDLGGAWIDADATAWELFARAGVFWEVYNSRAPAEGGSGWSQGAITSLGYRFLHDADALEGVEGSSETHNITFSGGWRSTWFWPAGIGLELRVLPTLSIPVDETQDGAWGQPVGESAFGTPPTLGNESDMSYGIDLELTVGVVF